MARKSNYKKINGRKYQGVGSEYTKKSDAIKLQKIQHDNGHNARIFKFQSTKGGKYYKVYSGLSKNRIPKRGCK